MNGYLKRVFAAVVFAALMGMVLVTPALGETNDAVPGVALGTSPQMGYVSNVYGDPSADGQDIYSVYMAVGETLDLTLSFPAGTNADLYVGAPGVANGATAFGEYTVDSAATNDNPETLLYTAGASGTHYINVGAWAGACSYTLTWSKTAPVAVGTYVTVGSSVGAPAYNTAVTLSSNLTANGWGVSGKTILFERRSGSSWLSVGSDVTDSNGKASVSVKPYAAMTTVYRARFAGTTSHIAFTSASATVKPKVYVTKPVAPTTARKSTYFAVYGFLKPRHTVGTYPVRIYKWRLNGSSWTRYGYSSAKAYAYSSTYTKYYRKIALTAGKWRLATYHPADTYNAATWSSGYDYVTVY